MRRRTCSDQGAPAFVVMVVASNSTGWVWMVQHCGHISFWWDQAPEGKNHLVLTSNTSSGIRKKDELESLVGSRSRRPETRQFYEGRGGWVPKHEQGVVSVDKIIGSRTGEE